MTTQLREEDSIRFKMNAIIIEWAHLPARVIDFPVQLAVLDLVNLGVTEDQVKTAFAGHDVKSMLRSKVAAVLNGLVQSLRASKAETGSAERATQVEGLLRKSLTEKGGLWSSRGLCTGFGLVAEVVDVLVAPIEAALQIINAANALLVKHGAVPLSIEQTDMMMLDMTLDQVNALKRAIVESGLPLQTDR